MILLQISFFLLLPRPRLATIQIQNMEEQDTERARERYEICASVEIKLLYVKHGGNDLFIRKVTIPFKCAEPPPDDGLDWRRFF